MGKIGAIELIVLLIISSLYFIPTIIAFSRKRNNRTAIFILNLFLGWTFVGWIASLVWACVADKPQTIVVNNSYSSSEKTSDPNKIEDKFESLKKLKDLLDSGVLSQSEFEEQKARILKS